MNRWLKTVGVMMFYELLCYRRRELWHTIAAYEFGTSVMVHKSQGSEWDNVIYYLTSKDEWIAEKADCLLPYVPKIWKCYMTRI